MRKSLRSAAWCLLAVLAACAGTEPPPPERDVIGSLLDLPPEREGPAIAAFVRAGRPRLLIEAARREPLEAEYGRLLPIALHDFEILRVVVDFADANVTLDPALAIVPEPRNGAGALPMYTPTRDLFMAFTGESPARSRSYYRLSWSRQLPWYINVATVGVLEIASLGESLKVKEVTVAADEEDHDRAAPKAALLATMLRKRPQCPWLGGPCELHVLVPRPRDDLPLRIDLDLELRAKASLRLSWSAVLPAGKPLAARLDDVFHGAAIDLADARVEPFGGGARETEHCRLREPLCATQKAQRAAAPLPPPVAAPAQLATPAESLAARPTWSDDEGYAPGATIDAVAPEVPVTGGPLRDALLICDLDTPIKVQELRVEARAGALPVHHPQVFEHEGHPRFVVPLVRLDAGESLSVAAKWRTHSWLAGTSESPIGKLQAKYGGSLPIAARSRRLGVSCVALGREAIEAQVTTRLAALNAALAEFDIGIDPIDESESDWGLGRWGATRLRSHVESIAGLIGWSDPRIRAVLPALEHYHALFFRHVGRLLAAKQTSLPAPGARLSFADADLRVVGSACGEQIDRRRVLWAREKVGEYGCVTIVEVIGRAPQARSTNPRTGSIIALFDLDLAWADGRRSDAWVVGVELPPGERRDPQSIQLAAGEAARFYLAPEHPYHQAGGPAPLFLIGHATGTTYVRLQ